MKEAVKEIVEKIMQNTGDYKWYGWTHISATSDRMFYVLEKGERQHRICIQAFTSKHLKILILLNFFCSAWEKTKFNSEKYYHWYQLRLTDELRIFGKKTLLDIRTEKGEDNYAHLKKLFLAIKNIANFIDQEKEKASKKDLEKALDLL